MFSPGRVSLRRSRRVIAPDLSWLLKLLVAVLAVQRRGSEPGTGRRRDAPRVSSAFQSILHDDGAHGQRLACQSRSWRITPAASIETLSLSLKAATPFSAAVYPRLLLWLCESFAVACCAARCESRAVRQISRRACGPGRCGCCLSAPGVDRALPPVHSQLALSTSGYRPAGSRRPPGVAAA